MIEFITTTALEYCDDVRDGTHDSPKHLDNGYILITSKNIKDSEIDYNNASYISEQDYNKINERSLVEVNDILYSMIGTVGLVHRVSQKPNYAIKNMGLFKISDEIRSKWLYYYLQSNEAKNEVNSRLSGSTQKFISLSNLRNMNVKYPKDKNDMKKTIKVLDSINNKIMINNQINNNLHELIRSMYDELVSNADWDEVELSQVASVSSGKRPTTKNETDEYPIIGANGIMAYTNEFNMNSDLIITGRVGTLGVVKRYYKPIWASDNTLIVNTKYLNYIECYLKTIDYNLLNRGSTQPLLTQGDLNKQTLLFSENEVLEFESKVIPIVNKIRFNEDQNEILSQLRDTLLPKLMNGEIDLDSIEI